jgi:hypothetical protein
VVVAGEAGVGKSRLVAELAAPASAPGPPPATSPGRLFELLLGVVHRLAARRPVLLVVEDLHWADRSTRDLLGSWCATSGPAWPWSSPTAPTSCTAATRRGPSWPSWSGPAGPGGSSCPA